MLSQVTRAAGGGLHDRDQSSAAFTKGNQQCEKEPLHPCKTTRYVLTKCDTGLIGEFHFIVDYSMIPNTLEH